MDDKNVSYIAYESAMARLERTNKRLFIICLILIISLIGTNGAWLYYESQFVDEFTIDAEQVTDGGNNYVVGGNYGTAKGEDY